ncbi:MAG TPA: cupin domain-containing protein [Chthoniobacterales bacterium]|nr:cupin domain-containing protein [Chthoniobacterales bacterium]
MRKANIAHIPEQERKSPVGKYHKFVKDVSVALGRDPASLDLAKRHPFDLAQVRIPPGKSYCPYHGHGSESELYVLLSGRATVRHAGGTAEVESGDSFFFGPGEAHQLTSSGPDDLVYYVIADNPRGDSCYYPDSNKWAVPREGGGYDIVQGATSDYHVDEE